MKTQAPTKEFIKETLEKGLNYEDSVMFLHCRTCLPKIPGDMPEGKSAHDIMNYEASSLKFTYPDGKIANIMVLWCKKCSKQVWDSRHLQEWI